MILQPPSNRECDVYAVVAFHPDRLLKYDLGLSSESVLRVEWLYVVDEGGPAANGRSLCPPIAKPDDRYELAHLTHGICEAGRSSRDIVELQRIHTLGQYQPQQALLEPRIWAHLASENTLVAIAGNSGQLRLYWKTAAHDIGDPTAL